MTTSRHIPPKDARIALLVAALDEDGQEFFQERAGIREFEAQMPRAEAEVAALAETIRYLCARRA